MMRLRPFPALDVVLCVLAVWSCGGSGSSDSTRGGSLNLHPVWQQPGGGSETTLPSAVSTVRVVFESNTGRRCCIAVDPTTVPIDAASGLRLWVLDQLPAGQATFTLSGWVTDFAPPPEGVTDTCPTSPADVGQPCEAVGPTTPSFQSQPQTVMIIPGTRARVPDIEVHALPFLLDLQPAPGDSSRSPVPIAFFAVDAATGIDRSSIAVEASFRSLTKRVPVTLSPCDDHGENKCSSHGQFAVTGFHAVGMPVVLSPGLTSLRITARNLASPADALDFNYDFTVLSGDSGGDSGGQPVASLADKLQAAGLGSEAAGPTEAAAGLQAASSTTAPPSRAEPTGTAASPPTPFIPRCPTPTATPTPAAEQRVEGLL